MVTPFSFLLYTCRGKVVVDSRGVFHERGGRTSFAPWDEIAGGPAEFVSKAYAGPVLRVWSALGIRTESGVFGNPACRIVPNRFFGLGFPLNGIHEATASRRPKPKPKPGMSAKGP